MECRQIFTNVPQIEEIKNAIPASCSFNKSTYFVCCVYYILENTIYGDLELLHTKWNKK